MGTLKHKRRSDGAVSGTEGTKPKKRRLPPKKAGKEQQDKVESSENCGGTQGSQVSESSVPAVQTSQLEVAVGNVHDNLEVLFEVKLKLQKGDVKGAFDMLQAIDRKIQASPDPKNKFLEPYVQKQFAEIAEAEASQEADLEKSIVEAVGRGNRQTGCSHNGLERARNRIHHFKHDLFEASVQMTSVIFALAFVNGLLAREIMSLFPVLESRHTAVKMVTLAALFVGIIALWRLRSKEDISNKNAIPVSSYEENQPLQSMQSNVKKTSKSALDGEALTHARNPRTKRAS